MPGQGNALAVSGARAEPGITVVKFGGSSLATRERIDRAAELIAGSVNRGRKLVVVVSAMGRTTDDFLVLARDMHPEHVDGILSMGERTSATVLHAALVSRGVRADTVDVSHPEWPILTDSNFGNANIDMGETWTRLNALVSQRMHEADVLVVPGFIGKTSDDRVTTLGRGGSDTTAFVVGGVLNAERVVLVSDIPGVMTADPKLVPDAQVIPMIDVERLAQLADIGAKFIHRKALRHIPNIPVRIISNQSRSLDAPGTEIVSALALAAAARQ